MANKNASQPAEEKEFSVTKERVNIASEATYQIEAMLNMLLKTSSADPGEFSYLVRGIGARINQLNNTIMWALCDSGMTEAELRESL